MTWKLSLTLLIAFLCVQSCSSVKIDVKRTKGPLPYDEEVTILSSYDTIPKGSYELARVKVRHNGLGEGCKYDELCNLAQLEARKIGGNIVQVLKHKRVSVISDCHKVSAVIYYNNPLAVPTSPLKKRAILAPKEETE